MKYTTPIGFLSGILIILLVAGCAPASPAASISIENAWGRPSPAMMGAGALYMNIKNSGNASDKLLSGNSPACGKVEVHETIKKADGTMGMSPVANPLEIPSKGQVELKSGSYHIMCMMMKPDQFKSGNQIQLSLQFEKAGEKTVTAEIKAQ